jgi:hypothetical protein
LIQYLVDLCRAAPVLLGLPLDFTGCQRDHIHRRADFLEPVTRDLSSPFKPFVAKIAIFLPFSSIGFLLGWLKSSVGENVSGSSAPI